MIGVVMLMMLSGVAGCYAAGSQPQKEAPTPPEDSIKIQMEAGEDNAVGYEYTPGTPLTITTRDANIVMNANSAVQLKYSEENRIAVKYLAVDVANDEPITLQIRGDNKPNATTAPGDGVGIYYNFASNDTAAKLTLRLFVDVENCTQTLGRPVSGEKLTWAYWNGEEWVPVQSHVDEQGNIVAEGGVGQWTIREMREVETPGDNPLTGTKTRALNYTDVEPQNFRYNLGEGESTLFMFNNAAMVLNSTNQLRLSLTVENEVRNRELGISVEAGGAMEMNVSITATPTGGAEAANGVGVYVNIEHNATLTKARLSMPLDVEALRAEYGDTFDPNQLTWAWWNGEAWVEVPSTLTSDNILTAETTHFSTWTIVESQTAADATTDTTTEATTAESPDYTWYIVGGGAVVTVAAAAIIMKSRK